MMLDAMEVVKSKPSNDNDHEDYDDDRWPRLGNDEVDDNR